MAAVSKFISETPITITSNEIIHKAPSKLYKITPPTVIYDRTDTMNEFKGVTPIDSTNTLNEFYKDSRWNQKNNTRSLYNRDHFARNTGVISTIAKMRYLRAMQEQTEAMHSGKLRKKTHRYNKYKHHKKRK